MVSLSKKVCLLGDFAVGKTSLVRRLVHDMFDDRYISTIGVKVSRKTITIARDQDIIDLSIILWDLAGSEEFNHMRASYLRGASGLFLVADVTRPATLANLPAYLADLDQSVGRIPIGSWNGGRNNSVRRKHRLCWLGTTRPPKPLHG